MKDQVLEQEIRDRIESALDELRPYLEVDEGGIALIEITDDMVAKLEYLGACKSCRMSMTTFKAGVEKAVMQSAPTITKVEVINMASE